uniref:RRM domain-containing protein n=1 Tax=Oryza rufipogon TaxID=4529 RepID=A0A0E0QU46_ORYRU
MPELRWSCCLCAQAFHLIDMVLQPQQAGPMMPLLAQPPLAMALLYSSFNIWTTLWAWTVETMALQELNQELSMWKDYLRTAQRERLHAGSCNLLCFVDFSSPPEARAALKTLQGYKFDEHDHESSNLRTQFSLTPRRRSIGGPCGNSLFHEAMSPHYVHRLNNQMSYAAGANQSAIPLGGMATYSAGMDSGNHGATRTE